jgi:hypothetical protein
MLYDCQAILEMHIEEPLRCQSAAHQARRCRSPAGVEQGQPVRLLYEGIHVLAQLPVC